MTATESKMVTRIQRSNMDGRYAQHPGDNHRQIAAVDRLSAAGTIALESGKGWIVVGLFLPRREPIKHVVGIDGRTYAY
jgi:hypothetical protein